MVPIPTDHIVDAHKLSADAKIMLFELTPAGGTGIFRFKADDEVTWRGNIYHGLPLLLTGDKESVEGGASQPTLQIGQENIDLSYFKPLINDGTLDGALIIRYDVLLENLEANLNIREARYYQVRRVDSYSRSQIRLQLGPYSDYLGFTMPRRQYLPPSFPAVTL